MLSGNRTFDPLGGTQVSHKHGGYASDVSEAQWQVLKALLARTGKRGRPMTLDLRAGVNGIFYVVRTGCQWKNLPQEYPNFNSVSYHFRKWSVDETWARVNRWLLYQHRHQQGRCAHPSAGVVDRFFKCPLKADSLLSPLPFDDLQLSKLFVEQGNVVKSAGDSQ